MPRVAVQVAADADTALQLTLQHMDQLLQAGQAALGAGSSSSGSSGLLGSYSDSSSITSLNTVAERGVDLQVGLWWWEAGEQWGGGRGQI
jgi:hypothetical protein